jgi:hypothetical protein
MGTRYNALGVYLWNPPKLFLKLRSSQHIFNTSTAQKMICLTRHKEIFSWSCLTSCVKPSRQECRTDLTIQGQTRFTLAKSEVCCDRLNRKQATSSHEALLLLTSLVNPSIDWNYWKGESWDTPGKISTEANFNVLNGLLIQSIHVVIVKKISWPLLPL